MVRRKHLSVKLAKLRVPFRDNSSDSGSSGASALNASMIKRNNKLLACALNESREKIRELEKDLMALRSENVELRVQVADLKISKSHLDVSEELEEKNNLLHAFLEPLKAICHEALNSSVNLTAEISRALSHINTGPLTNSISRRKRSSLPPLLRRSSERPRSHKIKKVSPMIGGHIVHKPDIKIEKLDMRLLLGAAARQGIRLTQMDSIPPNASETTNGLLNGRHEIDDDESLIESPAHNNGDTEDLEEEDESEYEESEEPPPTDQVRKFLARSCQPRVSLRPFDMSLIEEESEEEEDHVVTEEEEEEIEEEVPRRRRVSRNILPQRQRGVSLEGSKPNGVNSNSTTTNSKRRRSTMTKGSSSSVRAPSVGGSRKSMGAQAMNIEGTEGRDMELCSPTPIVDELEEEEEEPHVEEIFEEEDHQESRNSEIVELSDEVQPSVVRRGKKRRPTNDDPSPPARDLPNKRSSSASSSQMPVLISSIHNNPTKKKDIDIINNASNKKSTHELSGEDKNQVNPRESSSPPDDSGKGLSDSILAIEEERVVVQEKIDSKDVISPPKEEEETPSSSSDKKKKKKASSCSSSYVTIETPKSKSDVSDALFLETMEHDPQEGPSWLFEDLLQEPQNKGGRSSTRNSYRRKSTVRSKKLSFINYCPDPRELRPYDDGSSSDDLSVDEEEFKPKPPPPPPPMTKGKKRKDSSNRASAKRSKANNTPPASKKEKQLEEEEESTSHQPLPPPPVAVANPNERPRRTAASSLTSFKEPSLNAKLRNPHSVKGAGKKGSTTSKMARKKSS